MTVRVTVVDRQRTRRVAPRPLVRFLERAERAVPGAATRDGEVAVALLSDVKMRDLNRSFRGKDRTTDVLSFPGDGTIAGTTAPAYLGDIAISVPRAIEQARDGGHRFEREVKILALHGLLHLLGYDHERDDGRMMRLQRRIERRLLPPYGARR